MPLPIFTKVEDVPEAFRPEYEEKDGKWVPKAQEDDGLKEAGRKALQAERDARAAAETKAKELADKLKEAERKAQAAEAGVDLEAPEVKKWREQQFAEIRAEVADEVAKIRADAEKATGEARTLKLDNKVKALALKNGVQAERIEDWWALNGSSFELDDKGEPTVRDGKGKDVPHFISTDLKKARPYLYEGTKAAGGGAGGSSLPAKGTGGLSFEDFSKLSAADKLRVAREAEKDAA